MRLFGSARGLSPARVGVVLAGVLAGVLAVGYGTALASGAGSSAHMAMGSSTSSSTSMVGFTKGWYDGHTVTFKYSKNFFCRMPPASKASTACEGGALYTQTPASTFDPLYVVVPLGFTPAASTLQCPTAGKCIDHPSTIDLSAVLGASASNVLLPPHSHVIATDNKHMAEWWPVVVVGVTSQSAWNKIVAGKSLATVQALQAAGTGVTGNIPTNLFLYFASQN